MYNLNGVDNLVQELFPDVKESFEVASHSESEAPTDEMVMDGIRAMLQSLLTQYNMSLAYDSRPAFFFNQRPVGNLTILAKMTVKSGEVEMIVIAGRLLRFILPGQITFEKLFAKKTAETTDLSKSGKGEDNLA